MSKETVARIGKAIEEGQRDKNLREEQEAARQRAEALRREAEWQTLCAQNEAMLRATGVVDLFEELRDSRVVKLSKEPVFELRREKGFWGVRETKVKISDYTPASITWCLEKSEILIDFDGGGYYENSRERSGWISTHLQLTARILGNGELLINRHEMKPGEKLEDVVRDEILRVKWLKE